MHGKNVDDVEVSLQRYKMALDIVEREYGLNELHPDYPLWCWKVFDLPCAKNKEVKD